MTETGRLLKEKRIEANMSQDKLGEKLGYKSGQFVSNAERNLVGLPPTQFKALGKILDCDPKEFLRAHMKDLEVKIRKIAKI